MLERTHRSSDTKTVLLAVAGQTPAIITETLWALEQQRGIGIDEIRVITMSRRRDSIVSRLLGRDGGFAAYCGTTMCLPGGSLFPNCAFTFLSRATASISKT
jgi:hypothetical protein